MANTASPLVLDSPSGAARSNARRKPEPPRQAGSQAVYHSNCACDHVDLLQQIVLCIWTRHLLSADLLPDVAPVLQGTGWLSA
jgi:hypothetical protein